MNAFKRTSFHGRIELTIIGWQNGILSHPMDSGESLSQGVNILRRRFFYVL